MPGYNPATPPCLTPPDTNTPFPAELCWTSEALTSGMNLHCDVSLRVLVWLDTRLYPEHCWQIVPTDQGAAETSGGRLAAGLPPELSGVRE